MKKNIINLVSLTSLAIAGIVSGFFSFITNYFLNKYIKK
jgi:hypothetical protein